MGVLVRERPAGSGRWWVVVRRVGRAKWKLVGRGDEARAKADAVAKEVRDAIRLEGLGARLTALPVATVLEDWLELQGRTWRASTRRTNTGVVRGHLIPFFGSRDLRTITDADLLRFAAAKPTATARLALSALRAAASCEVRRGRLDRNPALGIDATVQRIVNAERREVPTRDAWSAAELQTLMRVIRDRAPAWDLFFSVAASTGMRQSELLGLRWEDVAWPSSRLHLRRAIVRGVIGPPKNGKDRFVPVTAEILAALRTELDAQRARIGSDGPTWIFTGGGAEGSLDTSQADRAWRRVRALAGREGVRMLPFHSFRHTYATLGLAGGHSPATLASWLGHTVAVFLRVYAHAIPTDEASLDFIGALVTPRVRELRREAPSPRARRSLGGEPPRNFPEASRAGSEQQKDHGHETAGEAGTPGTRQTSAVMAR